MDNGKNMGSQWCKLTSHWSPTRKILANCTNTQQMAIRYCDTIGIMNIMNNMYLVMYTVGKIYSIKILSNQFYFDLNSLGCVDSTVKLENKGSTFASCPGTPIRIPYVLFIRITKFFCFRKAGTPRHRPNWEEPEYISPSELENAARIAATESRAKPAMPGSNLMFDPKKPRLFGTDTSTKKLRPKVLTTAIARQAPSYSNTNPKKDEVLNRKFLQNSKMIGTFNLFPSSETISTIFNGECPVIDSVVWHSTCIDTWGDGVINQDALMNVQERRGFSVEYPNTVQVQELIWGKSTEAEIEDVRKFASQNIQRNIEEVSIAATSLDNEEIKMVSSDYKKLMEPLIEGEEAWFQLKTELPEGDSWVQYPAKIMIGDGDTWAVMITAPVILEKRSDDPDAPVDIWAKKFEMQPGILAFLRDIPCPTGVGIRSDIMGIEDMIVKKTGKPFEMDDFVEISVMAIAAGYNDGVTNMSALAWNLLGAIMNKHCSQGDRKWGHYYSDLPSSLRAYCLGDLKFGRQAVITLFAIMIQNLFPDPDVVLAFTRTDHKGFGSWFGYLVLQSLKGVELHAAALQEVAGGDSLRDLYLALRCREMLPGGKTKLSVDPPERIWVLFALYGDWPSVTKGGCRYLLEARQHFVKQHDMLTSRSAYGWKDLYYPLNQEMLQAAVYGITDMERYDFTKPTDVRLGLGQHPDRRNTASRFEFGNLTSAQVMRMAKKDDGARREMTYEAARLGYMNVNGFLDRVKDDKYFMQWPRSYYLEIQNIYRRATGDTKRHDVPYLKNLLIHNAEKSINDVWDVYERTAKKQEQRLVRIQHLEEEVARAHDETLPLSTLSYRGQLPVIGTESTKLKGSMRDLPNRDRAEQGRAYMPPSLGEKEALLINPEEYFPLGRAPARSGRRRAGGAQSVRPQDVVEEQERQAHVSEDGWEMVQPDRQCYFDGDAVEPDEQESFVREAFQSEHEYDRGTVQEDRQERYDFHQEDYDRRQEDDWEMEQSDRRPYNDDWDRDVRDHPFDDDWVADEPDRRPFDWELDQPDQDDNVEWESRAVGDVLSYDTEYGHGVDQYTPPRALRALSPY